MQFPDARSPDGPEATPDTAWQLAPSLDLTWADTLHGELQGRIARDRPLLIDGSGVERVSTACVQLLAAAAMSARAHGLAFRITARSEILDHAVRDLGLGDVLGMEEG